VVDEGRKRVDVDRARHVTVADSFSDPVGEVDLGRGTRSSFRTASVLADQSAHTVLSVSKQERRRHGGLRVVRSGLTPADKVVVDGIPMARPGSVVDLRVEPSKVALNNSATE
jgi:hypothetical protein